MALVSRATVESLAGRAATVLADRIAPDPAPEVLAARAQASRAVLLWAVASAVATVISSLCGFSVLHGIASEGWDAVPVRADALVTGILAGSGTKPVHDLITRARTGP